MKTIPLTDNEINHIKEVYSQELERLQKRAHEISSILKKLQGKAETIAEEKKVDKIAAKAAVTGKRKYNKKNAVVSANTEKKDNNTEQKTKGKRGRPAKIKTAAKADAKTEAKIIKKRGRKPNAVKPLKAAKATKATKATKPAKVAKTSKATAKTAKVKTKAVKAEKTAKAKTGKTAKTSKTAKTAKVSKAVKTAKTSKPAKAAKTVKTAKATKTAKAVKPTKAIKTAKTAKTVKPVAEKGKRGRKKSENSKKSRWTTTIIELLEGQGKLLSSRAIVDEVMKSQSIPTTDYSKTRSIIAGSLSDLVLETKRLKTIPIRGQKGNLYGLTQWFDNSGNLLDKNKMQ